MPLPQYASYTKFRDSWAIRVPGTPTVGAQVQTRRSDGQVKTVEVTEVLSNSNGLAICGFRDISGPAATKVSKRQQAASPQNRRTSSNRQEGVQEGQYRSVREGRGGDEIGRVCFLKSQGNRIPVTVVGWECQYVRDDGLSFGFPADDGWFVSSYYRDATPEEAAELIAKDEAQKAEVDAKRSTDKAKEEADMTTALAPLEGLVSCDMVELPAGNRERVGSFGRYPSVTVTKITMADGTVVFQHEANFSDDYRSSIYATPEVINQLREALIVKRPTLTKEAAEEFLTKYRGCVGTDFYEWRVARS